MEQIKNNIQHIVDQALCTGCGTCAGVCTRKAITMQENAGGFLAAQVDMDRCAMCGKCLKTCPSYADNQSIESVSDSIHGNNLRGYIGYASQKRVRREGQSGGIVTALLLYLLETDKIDGAITNQFDATRNRPKAVYVDSAEDIKKSTGSYYCQSSVGKTVLEHNDKRLAAVVLGCQAEALRLCRASGVATPDYTIGLVCAGQNSGHMIDSLHATAGCNENETVQQFRFRYAHPAYGGWPGNILIVTDKWRYRLDKSKRHALKPLCEAYRCLLCYDQMCIDADVVCGDPWGIPGNHAAGETVIIARTEKGRALVEDARDAGYISVRDLSVQQIIAGETVDGRHKNKISAGYIACEKNGWQYPYTVSNAAAKEFSSLPHKVYRKLQRRIEYTRARYLAATMDEVEALSANYRNYLAQDERAAQWQKLMAFPKRLLRYLYRKLK